MNLTPNIVTLGESMLVLYPPDPTAITNSSSLLFDMGGAESNFSIGLARLGHHVSYLSKVGNDPFGEILKNILRTEKVDISHLITDEEHPTGIFFRECLPDGARRVYYYRKGSAASTLCPSDIPEDFIENASLLHLTGLTPALSDSCCATVEAAITRAKSAKTTISFDPNYRVKLWGPEIARKTLEPFMRQADILLIGDEDAHHLFGPLATHDMLSFLQTLGPTTIVYKEGAKGALGWTMETGIISVPPAPISSAIDPVGAGDGFAAGFISSYLKKLPLIECLERGAFVGARAVEVVGDYAGYPRI